MATLYSAIVMKSYVMSIVCSGTQVGLRRERLACRERLLRAARRPRGDGAVAAPACAGAVELEACRHAWTSTPGLPQVVALMYYVMSYFPGGASGVKFMLTVFYKAVMSCMSGVTRIF
jgi:hypothetical protein